ncbi:hypothetical protein GCM10010260_19320 [Streptomyces filipinensis]|uniref:Restriction endonuclease type IV Mrr domain-containing protein n=2 Tax=Streptomyces filipinensis TaxID=66887 RepID=A0A918I8A0_9ACTN|nr:hypothetical protein [Streptomyces filipinensis]GGU86366.1 hypothetical protein GCM10010260_19320 [Streptomyces filipinensis]
MGSAVPTLFRRDAWGWAMTESVPVRCPACRREHVYTAPVYPCACGAPTAPRLDPSTAPAVAAHRAWDDEWIAVPCAGCGRSNQWPQPELGCVCGTVLRIPVTRTPPAKARPPSAAPQPPADTGAPSAPAGPKSPARRGAFQPRAIRTARDAVTVAALYLRWLGYRDIRRADQRPPNGIGLAARGLLAQVDPTVRPAAPRDVECLWLTAMTESADCVYFSLAGYTEDARTRADRLDIPLFVLDLAGVPQPLNDPADTLDSLGAPKPETRSPDGQG